MTARELFRRALNGRLLRMGGRRRDRLTIAYIFLRIVQEEKAFGGTETAPPSRDA